MTDDTAHDAPSVAESWAAISISDTTYIVPASHFKRPIGAAVDDIRDRDHYAQVIAVVRGDRHGRGSQKDHAALIAAAPEAAAERDRLREVNKALFGALDAVRPYFEEAHDPDHLHCIQMRAALAKAKEDTGT